MPICLSAQPKPMHLNSFSSSHQKEPKKNAENTPESCYVEYNAIHGQFLCTGVK